MNELEWKQRLKMELRFDRKHFSKIAFGLLLYLIIGEGLQIFVYVFLYRVHMEFLLNSTNFYMLLMMISMYCIALPITACYFKIVPRFGCVRREKWGWKAWLVVYLIGVSMAMIGNLIGNQVTNIFGSSSASFDSLIEMIFEGNLWLTYFTICVGAPIAEEFLFRKFLIDRTIGYGEKMSVLLSGLLFGIVHGNFEQFFYAFALGCLFAYIYCKTGKIRNTIFFHMWINFRSSILIPLLMRPLEPWMQELNMANAEGMLSSLFRNPAAVLAVILLSACAIIEIGFALAGFVLFFVFKKYIYFYPGIRRLPKKLAVNVILFNPGMIIFLLLCLYEFCS